MTANVVADASREAASGPPEAKRRPARSLAWLAIAPFFAFAAFFLIVPTLTLVIGAFQTPAGNPTFQNILGLFTPQIMAAYSISIQISLASAGLGAFFGFFLAYAIVHGGLPGSIRPFIVTFSGVASNFAGIPLAFAFIATLGRIGLVTLFLKDTFDFNIYRYGFNLLSFWGLTITYLYFQIPLIDRKSVV